MNSLVQGRRRSNLEMLALAMGIWGLAGSPARADTGVVQGLCHQGSCGTGTGTLGYGGYGSYPGLYGFGLKFHPGYGYGGNALGVGVFGGYPYYGGPGYPHPETCLRRCGGITPFLYYGGPGYPSFEFPNYYGGVGPLAVDRQVVTIADQPGPGYGTSFGPFTGAFAYPETMFAPYASAPDTRGSTGGMGSSSPTMSPSP
jgi:hypothetical protein